MMEKEVASITVDNGMASDRTTWKYFALVANTASLTSNWESC